jgi:hypothetical protein
LKKLKTDQQIIMNTQEVKEQYLAVSYESNLVVISGRFIGGCKQSSEALAEFKEPTATTPATPRATGTSCQRHLRKKKFKPRQILPTFAQFTAEPRVAN